MASLTTPLNPDKPVTAPENGLSRDSLIDQRIDASLTVERRDGGVNGAVLGFGVGEGWVGQMMRFEVVPDTLDLVRVLAAFQRVPGPLPAEVFFAAP